MKRNKNSDNSKRITAVFDLIIQYNMIILEFC